MRFDEFKYSWKVTTLGEITRQYRESNKNVHHQNLLSLSYGKIVRKDIESKKGLLPASFDTYQIIKKDIIVFRVTDLQNDKKSLRVGISEEEGIITPAYVCMECDTRVVDPHYLYTLLHYYDDITKVYYKMGDGMRQTLAYSDLKELKVYLPNFPEQHKIVECFELLDKQIQISSKKIASLRQMKTASLHAMFPQKGETRPRVRFKGFEGEWEKVQFSELYEPSSIKNKTFGADKIISVANMYFKPVSYISDEEYLKSYNVMNLGDIAFEGNKSKDYAHGRFVENTIGDGIVSHVFIVLKPISKQYDLQFWKYLINYERIMGPILLRSTKHSTMMTDLVVSDFLKESVLVPSCEEQIEIGKILSSLDRQITLHTQRLEKLKQIKTACLDEMFV